MEDPQYPQKYPSGWLLIFRVPTSFFLGKRLTSPISPRVFFLSSPLSTTDRGSISRRRFVFVPFPLSLSFAPLFYLLQSILHAEGEKRKKEEKGESLPLPVRQKPFLSFRSSFSPPQPHGWVSLILSPCIVGQTGISPIRIPRKTHAGNRVPSRS